MLHYVIAISLILHGLGHMIGFLAAWTALPMGFSDRPWVLTADVRLHSPVGRAFGMVWLAALIGFVSAGLGLAANHVWWAALAAAAAVFSLAAVLPWWKTVAPGPRFWILLVDAAIVVALVPSWGTRIAEAILSV